MILGDKDDHRLLRELGLAGWLNLRSLAGWLEVATDGLEATAKQRIETEIQAHYAEAISDHLAAGDSEDSAGARALTDLGDPRDAARSFRRSHLTESEAKWLRSLRREASLPLYSFQTVRLTLINIFFLVGTVLLAVPGHRSLGGEMLIYFVGARLIPRLLHVRTRAWFRSACVVAVLCYLSSIGVCLVLLFAPGKNRLFYYITMQCWLWMYCRQAVPIMGKLRNISDPSSESGSTQVS
jgi:hypothetical protein